MRLALKLVLPFAVFAVLSPASAQDNANVLSTEALQTMAIGVLGPIEFCKGSDPDHAAAYDAWYMKNWSDKHSEVSGFQSKPAFVEKVEARRKQLEEQAKDPQNAATLKTSCDTFLNSK